ncbi:MAG: hypothetical protein IKZ88_00050 [Neisseriaceae bacterium]|nr:hypothetical protein [Neisseriaceae bacterium]
MSLRALNESSRRGNPVKKSLDFFTNAARRCNALFLYQLGNLKGILQCR